MKKVWRIVTIIIVSLVVLLLLSYVSLWVIFEGGIQGAINNLKSAPDPKGIALNQKRETVIAVVNNTFEDINTVIGFKEYETSKHDSCYKG